MKVRWKRSSETKPIISVGGDSSSDSDGPDGIYLYTDGYISNSQAPSKRKRRIAFACVATVFVAILGGLLYYYFSKKTQEYENVIFEETQHVHVDIQGGRVCGVQERSVVVFKGIPYAKPPINSDRWRPPIPCERNICWNGTFNATEFGNMCAQQDSLNVTGDPRNVLGREDCLFINVWTPRKRPNKKRLPVLIYIHGGYLSYSSGNWKGLHPTGELVSELNIVGVSFNYRLNAFGFMALKSLADDSRSNTSGNYGFMDQMLALRWVQTNIEKFGGDPDSVTLLGQSSGGTSELALLASPNTTRLFHRAVLMSASPILNKSWDQAAVDNTIFVKNANCRRNSSEAERSCLYSLTPREIQDAIPWDEYPYWRMEDSMDLPTKDRFDGAVAVVDGDVVPSPPVRALATGEVNDVPLIIGTTAQEINIQPLPTVSSLAEYETQVLNKLKPFLGSGAVTSVLDMYNGSLSHDVSTRFQFAYTSMASDLRVTCPTNLLALNASKGLDSSVYRYLITNSPSKPVNVVGYPAMFAFHMWDLIAFFGFPGELHFRPSEKDKKFMKSLRKELGEFIQSGTVKTESWKEFPETTALFTDSGLKILEKDGYHKKECDFWLSNGFFSYAWIN